MAGTTAEGIRDVTPGDTARRHTRRNRRRSTLLNHTCTTACATTLPRHAPRRSGRRLGWAGKPIGNDGARRPGSAMPENLLDVKAGNDIIRSVQVVVQQAENHPKNRVDV
jgi:hypothetical protein